MFGAGVLALIIGRFVSARRGRVNVPAPVILPAMCAAAVLGLALQMGYGDPLHWQFWPGPEFARGFALAALIGLWVTLRSTDYGAIARRAIQTPPDQSRYDDDPIRWGIIATVFWGMAGFLCSKGSDRDCRCSVMARNAGGNTGAVGVIAHPRAAV